MHSDKDRPSRFGGGLSTEDLAQQSSGGPAHTTGRPDAAPSRAPVFPGESTGEPAKDRPREEQPRGEQPGADRPATDERPTAAGTPATASPATGPGDTAMPAGATEAEGAGRKQDMADDTARTGPAGEGTAGAGAADGAAGEDVPRLLTATDEQGFRDRWREIQSKFVDDPREAVHTADTLVADVMQTLAATFAHHKQDLEGQWSQGERVDTEDLRKALRRYRSFFNRLLEN
ncbi:hypothetical protein ABZ858_05930 [Streptomyces sp. NPDC047017]|uniref:hypothetical protein n=1 Tax=Streptomyces sp. NPDC047017 TaxID=3155024 RepID=UPI0033D7926E